jgi:hypothetical protein
MNTRTPSIRKTLLSAAAVALAACGGGETASLRFAAVEPHTHTATAQRQGPTAQGTYVPKFRSSDGLEFVLSEARIHLKDIRVELPQGAKCAEVRGLPAGATCEAGETSTVKIPGPILVDMVTSASTPDLSGLRLPPGTYHRIDFRLDEAKAGEVPADEPLVGSTLRVKATFIQVQNGTNTLQTLELNLKFSEDARFESTTGLEVFGNDTLVALLNPQMWLDGLPVASCLEKGDLVTSSGVLRFDASAKGDCSGAETLVKANIKRSGEMRWSQY